MKKTLLSMVVVGSLFAASNGYEVGAGLGYNDVTKSDRFKSYGDLNLRIGKYLQKNTLLRLELEQTLNKNDITSTKFLVNGEYDFSKYQQIEPYAFGGIGYQVANQGYKDSAVMDLGIGGKYEINEQLNAFAEIRALRDFGNNDNHFGGLVGVSYNFGQTIPDSDNDGINDNLDKCPNTPDGVKVDANGCPIDSDNDGVADYLDKCPNTPAGVKVNSEGCQLEYNFGINFPNNSDKLTPLAIEKTSKFAEFLRKNPNAQAVIEGYTDNKGNAQYNQKLSEKRAKAVYNELIKLGIDKSRLSYRGLGEANPIASNATEEGRKLNRRVIAKITYK